VLTNVLAGLIVVAALALLACYPWVLLWLAAIAILNVTGFHIVWIAPLFILVMFLIGGDTGSGCGSSRPRRE
jgi:hypothetical protein